MFTGMKKHGKGSVVHISAVFGPFCHIFCGRDLLNGILQTFIESPISETVIWEMHRRGGSSFFENVENLMEVSRMVKIIQKKSFVSEIIVSVLVALNCLYKEENTSHCQSMC